MRTLVIIPTLNEVQNIAFVINDILNQHLDLDILVVDGNSNDGTVEVVQDLGRMHRNVMILPQGQSGDFGGALKLGFRFALDHGYDPIITMDGDHSHSAVYLNDFLLNMEEYDLQVGSRYVDGVRVEGWRFRKLLMSKLANMYVSYLLVKPIWDFTSGFRCYRRRFIEALDLPRLHAEAYIIQIELLDLAYKLRFRVKEIPFIYRGTKEALSKISAHSRRKTFYYVFKFRAPLLEILRHLAYLKKEYERFVEEYEELVNPPKLKNQGRFEVKDNYSISIGVMAYNEEKIIANCLNALRRQQLSNGIISEIIVVSSGSTDRTDEIVTQLAQEETRIRLIIQPQRQGKASAINEFLKQASGDIAIIESGDTVTLPNTVQELIKPFADAQVGMSGAHPVPVNNRKSFVGYCVHRLWELHHQIAMDSPKCGEMVAFRNIISRIPKYTAVDEAAIEANLCQAKFKLAYCPQAVVQNKGPETLHDFIKQRRRIASGHKHLKATTGHVVTTQKSGKLWKYVLNTQRWTPREIIYMLLLLLIEAWSRFIGSIDFYLRDKNPFIWDISLTTKKM